MTVSSIDSKNWLPAGKTAAVCFSIDDIHPGKSTDYYEAGGDLDKGVLKHLLWLQERHPELRTTLFVTADWREICPFPTRKFLARIPILRDRCFLAPGRKVGTMSLENHPQFVRFLRQLPNTEIAFHGLHHYHRGPLVPVEFQDESEEQIAQTLSRMIGIFKQSQIPFVNGMCPPGWNAPQSLIRAMVSQGLRFLASARDLNTPITLDATTNMHGLKGLSLIFPQVIAGGKLVHLPANFSPTCPVERAVQILEHGGFLSIKAHAVKECFGKTAADGLDESYRHYLDALFRIIKQRFGDSIFWTTMDEVANNVLSMQFPVAGS